MSMWLRQSTASQEVLLGPFLSTSDGYTPQTGLTINNTDIKLWKENATTEFNKNSLGAFHIASGRYYAQLDATDTNTLGKLEINVAMTGALPVRREYMVLPAVVYDALVFGTDNLDVSAVQLAGQTITAGAGVTFPSSVASPTNITGGTITTVTNLTNLPSIPAGWLTAAGIDTGALNGKGDWNIGKTGYSLTQGFPANFSSMSISVAGLVDITQTAADKTWGTTARTLTAGTNIALAKGTGITGFNDLDAAGVAGAVWNAATASYGTANTYGALIETNLDAAVSSISAGSGPSAATIADAVWDEALSGHATAGSAGAGLSAAGSAGDPWATLLPGAYGAGTAGKIIGDNIDVPISTAGGSSLTEAGIADAVWDEALSGHTTSGTAGAGLTAAGAAGDPWSTTLPGAYGAGTAGKLLSDNLNATVSSRASQTSVDTLDDYVDTEIAAIKAKTDNLPTDPADASDIATAFSGVNTKLDTIDDFLDTEIAAIKTKTDFLPSATAGAAGGLFIAGANAATTVNFTGNLSGSVGSVTGAVGSVTGAVGSVTAGVTLAAATHTGAVIPTVTNLTNLPSIPSGWLTAAGIAASALNGKGDWPVGKTGYSLTQAFPANFSSLDISVAGEVTAVGGGGGGTADWTADQITAISSILGIPASGTTPTDPTTGILDTIRDAAVAIKAKTDNLPVDPADASDIAASFTTVNTKLDTIDNYIDTEIAAIKTDTTTIIADTNDIQTRIPTTLVGGRMDCNIGAVNNDTATVTAFKRAVDGTCVGTVGGGSSTTSVVSSALTPAGSVATQFKGRVLTFDRNTTTAALRGQSTDITASTAAAAPVFTVTALTTAPVAGDVFSLS